MSSVLDELLVRLEASTAHNHATECRPAIVLWPDAERRWYSAVPKIRARAPHLWSLGAYDPKSDTGPAPWVKWKLGQSKPGAPVPILYMPGHGRSAFRSPDTLPDDLRPLAELAFRGSWFSQSNGKDWTPLAFLTSKKGGLGVTVAEDSATTSALERLVGSVLDANLVQLQSRILTAFDFFALTGVDLESDVLSWLDSSAAFTSARSPLEFDAFRDHVRLKLNLDVDADGPVIAADRLAACEGGWSKVWARYEEAAPDRYPNLYSVLLKAHPASLVPIRRTLPRINESEEKELKEALSRVAALPAPAARARIRELEQAHGERRQWVWAKLGRAPLAQVLEPLAALASSTEKSAGPLALRDLSDWYSGVGWAADFAALKALSFADHTDGPVICDAVRALYLPWLQALADDFAQAVKREGYPREEHENLDDGTCVLFADGLRLDLATVLAARLKASGATVETRCRWSAFPPVTGTSKPYFSPVASLLVGGLGAGEFVPDIKGKGTVLDTSSFRKLLADLGIDFLTGHDVGTKRAKAWTEIGDIDSFGHQQGAKLARHFEHQLDELVQRIDELLVAGWERIRVITDHGWLLLPGGLPPSKLPAGLTESRWGRCALLKSSSKSELPSLPWSWNSAVEVTYAPGVSAFFGGKEYAHGGLSLQECVTPVLVVSRKGGAKVARVSEVKWVGLRCRVSVEGDAADLSVDLRTKVSDPSTSVATAPKALEGSKSCSVPVADPDLAGTAAFVVLLASGGEVLDKKPTTVGGD